MIDFLHADETLQARGAAIVCVEQSIDMTTGEGRAFAQMLAVFGEMEASAISSRIMAARAHLISQGRVAGGLQPYGWRTVPHPDGPGRVRGQDPERIEWVRGMAERVLRGDTVYSIQTWLNAAGAPAPRARQPGRPWGYSSVDILMRNPVLAGMFPIHSRNQYGPDGPEVRRDDDGQPIVADDGDHHRRAVPGHPARHHPQGTPLRPEQEQQADHVASARPARHLPHLRAPDVPMPQRREAVPDLFALQPDGDHRCPSLTTSCDAS